MHIRSKTRTGIAVALLMTTAGCLGSGGGGGGVGAGGGGQAGIDAYDAAYADATANVLANAPTSNMPLSGTATYSGEAKIDLVDGSGSIGTLLGETSISVSFADPIDTNTTASMTNLRGIDADGTEVTYSGELTSDYWFAETGQTAGGVAITTIANPAPVGPRELRTGALSVTVAGELEQADSDLLDAETQVSVLLGGAFQGSGGAQISGPAGLNVWQNGAPANAGGTGTHYATKD